MAKPKKAYKAPVKVACLYHDELGKECICIHPVKTQEKLIERKESQARLEALQKKYGVA